MILSQLELAVLKAIAQSMPQYPELCMQIEIAEVSKREYTGCGVYTNFAIPSDAPRFDQSLSRMEEMPWLHGDHPALEAGAGFILWCQDGHISCLEGFTYVGDWPNDEHRFSLRA